MSVSGPAALYNCLSGTPLTREQLQAKLRLLGSGLLSGPHGSPVMFVLFCVSLSNPGGQYVDKVGLELTDAFLLLSLESEIKSVHSRLTFTLL